MWNRGNRIMSSSGTPHHTARHRSGRCVSAAPTKQPAVGATEDGEAIAVGATGGDEPIRSGMEVVEDVLLRPATSGVMPLLTVLQPATQTGDGIEPTGRAPRRSAATRSVSR